MDMDITGNVCRLMILIKADKFQLPDDYDLRAWRPSLGSSTIGAGNSNCHPASVRALASRFLPTSYYPVHFPSSLTF